MPYIKAEAISLQDLLDKTVQWVTDTNIHGDDAWELVRNDPWPRGTIFKAKGVNGINHCYIGMMLLTHVKGSSYKNWLLQTKNIGKYVVRSNNALALGEASFIYKDGDAFFNVLEDQYNIAGKTTKYTLSGIDIVNADCTSLVFGVFKQYAEGLDWHEQPGGIEFNELAQYPIYYSINNSGSYALKPPIYPGVGYPGIGMNSGEPSGGWFDYWLSKDASRITVAIKNQDQWDMGHAGMLVPYHAKMQYAFPAVVAGSCTGLQTVSTTAATTKITTTGAKIDYGYNHYTMSRSMPCAPCTNVSTKTPENSQVGLCLPDGKWKFFSNWRQITKVSSLNGSYYSTVERPTSLGNTGYIVGPANNNLTGVISSLSGDHTLLIEPLDLLQEDKIAGCTNLLGSLWNMYWPGVDEHYGEIKINGKAYLLLPNCWEDRLWHIPLHSNTIVTPENLLAEQKEIIKFGKQFRLLIKLED